MQINIWIYELEGLQKFLLVKILACNWCHKRPPVCKKTDSSVQRKHLLSLKRTSDIPGFTFLYKCNWTWVCPFVYVHITIQIKRKEEQRWNKMMANIIVCRWLGLLYSGLLMPLMAPCGDDGCQACACSLHLTYHPYFINVLLCSYTCIYHKQCLNDYCLWQTPAVMMTRYHVSFFANPHHWVELFTFQCMLWFVPGPYFGR